MRGALAIAAGLLAACTNPARLTLEQAALPPDVVLAAALGVDEGGGLVGATGLAPIEDGRVIAFGDVPGAVRYEAIGFTRADLAPLGPLPGETVLRASQLFAADPRGAQLPPASWRVAFDGEGRATTDGPAARLLAAAWLPDCPRLVGPGQGVTVSCAPERCTPTASQTGCALRVDTTTCGFGLLDAQVGARGEVIAERTALGGLCEAIAPDPGVGLALSCSGGQLDPCTVEVHTSTAPPPVEIDTVPLAPGAPPFADPYSIRPFIGYLTGLVIVGDVVMVTRNLDRVYRWDECPPARRGVVDLIDARTLAVRTATAPACIVRAVHDPIEDALLYVTGGEQPRIGRIRPDGRVEGDRPLVVDRAPGHLPVQLLATPQPRPRLFVALTVGFTITGTGATLAELDPRTFAQQTSTYLDQRVELMGLGLDGGVQVVGDFVDQLYTVTPTGQLAAPLGLWDVCSGGFRLKPAALLAHPTSRRMIIPTLDDDSPAAYVLEESERCRRVPLPGSPGSGTGAALWAARPEVVLVGVMRGIRGGVALLDPVGGRFVGGVREAGHGPLDLMQGDARGFVWALQPWTSAVVRVRPSE